MSESPQRDLRILEACLEDLQQGDKIQACLERCPSDQQAEMEALLRAAQRLRSAGVLQARPQFRAASSERLRSRLTRTPQRSPLPAPQAGRMKRPAIWRSLAVSFALSVLIGVSILLGAGLLSASAQALPGDTLYSVKLAEEQIRLTLAQDAAQRIDVNLEIADRRLDESTVLVALDRPEQAVQALFEYRQTLQRARTGLSEIPDAPTPAQVQAVELWLRGLAVHPLRLQMLVEEVDSPDRSQVVQTLDASQTALQQANEILQKAQDARRRAPEPAQIPSQTPVPSQVVPAGGGASPEDGSLTPEAVPGFPPVSLTPTGRVSPLQPTRTAAMLPESGATSTAFNVTPTSVLGITPTSGRARTPWVGTRTARPGADATRTALHATLFARKTSTPRVFRPTQPPAFPPAAHPTLTPKRLQPTPQVPHPTLPRQGFPTPLPPPTRPGPALPTQRLHPTHPPAPTQASPLFPTPLPRPTHIPAVVPTPPRVVTPFRQGLIWPLPWEGVQDYPASC